MVTTEARLQMLLDACSDGVWELDDRGVTTFVNRRLCELFGYLPHDLVGRSFLDFVDVGSRAEASESLAAGVAGPNAPHELRFVRKDRTTLWLQTTARPLIADGGTGGFVVLCSDLTATKEQQELLRSLQEMADVGGWELDVASGRTVWTEQIYRIYAVPLGTPTDRAQGIAHYAPEDRLRIAACVDRCIHGEPFQGTFAFVDAQERPKWVEVRGEPVRDASGTVYKLRGTIQDITSKHRAQQEAAALREALQTQLAELGALKTRFDLALEGASLGIWDWDLRTNKVQFDRRWCEMLGLDPVATAMKLSSWEDRVHPDDLAGCYADIQAYREGRTPVYENIHRMRHASGEWIYILDRGRYSGWDARGEPIRFTGTHFDITAAVRARLQAEDVKARLELAELSGRFGSWELDLRTMRGTWSEGHNAVFELDPSVVPTSYDTFLSRVVPEDRSVLEGALADIVGGRTTAFEVDYRVALPNGALKHVRGHGRAQVGDDGRPVKVAGTVLDVTELVESKAAVEEALRARSRFLANISHEIRTPMNGILGMLAILLESDLDPTTKQRLQIVHDSGSSLLELLNDVLDYSKLEADKVGLESEPLPLVETVKGVVDLFAPRAAEKGVALAYHPADTGPSWIRGDVTRLRQVLTNLVSNAIKFTAAGRVDVSWTSTPVEDGRWEVRFAIQDTGVGIPVAARAKLFQAFSQADGSTTRRFGGTGLGLAISKELCERMHGRIWLESEVGQGSTFFFTVQAPACDAPTAVVSPAPPVLRGSLPEPSPLRILLAEDNPTNQVVATTLLARLGCQVDLANDGQAAVTAEAARPYDLILMDCQMPELDGFEASRRIRARHGPGEGPRIVAFTAGMVQEDLDRCYAAGMEAVIAKPVTIPALVEVLASTRRRT